MQSENLETDNEKDHYTTLQEKAGIIGNDPNLIEIIKMIVDLRFAPLSILFYGETGTGKELFFNLLRLLNPRILNALIVNCPGLEENLFGSDLWGHEKGAFTGAVARRIGKIERAHNGMLFLDEISRLGLTFQDKMLRVLQDGFFERVGGNKPIKSTFRLVSATNENLKDKIEKGEFKQDFYFRIAQFVIKIPPLRERGDDIVLLANHFIKKACRAAKKKPIGLHPNSIKILKKHNWPGNIRELENLMNNLTWTVKGQTINPEDLSHLLNTDNSSDTDHCSEKANHNHKLYEDIFENLINTNRAYNKKFSDDFLQYLYQIKGLSTQEVADFFGVNPSTITRKIIAIQSSNDQFGENDK